MSRRRTPRTHVSAAGLRARLALAQDREPLDIGRKDRVETVIGRNRADCALAVLGEDDLRRRECREAFGAPHVHRNRYPGCALICAVGDLDPEISGQDRYPDTSTWNLDRHLAFEGRSRLGRQDLELWRTVAARFGEAALRPSVGDDHAVDFLVRRDGGDANGNRSEYDAKRIIYSRQRRVFSRFRP